VKKVTDHVEELLSAYIDHELTEEEAHRVRDHIKTCESCRETLYSLQHVRDQLHDAYEKVEVPASLEQAVMASIAVLERKTGVANGFGIWLAGVISLIVMGATAALMAPILIAIAKFLYKLAGIGIKIWQTVPIVVGAIPYFTVILYGATIILIIVSVGLLLRLRFTGSYDRRELL
jgi:predicted anti-sigma-YlaC factor YlaD